MTLASDLSMTNRRARDRGDIVLGEDWDRPQGAVESELRAARQRRGMRSLNRSPLARKIIIFNLLAIVVLVAGVLYLNPFRDSLVLQRERGLAIEAQLIADVFEASLPRNAPADLNTGDGIDPEEVLGRIGLTAGLDVFIYTPSGVLVASTDTVARNPVRPVQGLVDDRRGRSMLITDFLNSVWDGIASVLSNRETPQPVTDNEVLARALLEDVVTGGTVLRRGVEMAGTIYVAATPIEGATGLVGVVAVTTAAGEIDQLVRAEREQLLQMFVIALLVSIGLSLVLASTIANPLSDLSAAAELGRDKNARKMSPTRVRIPDLTGRPDEIGRLSGALRGMVDALYDRIDSNEQFAADVSHEIKNPLASLQSAVGTMRVARTEDQRNRLLEVIEHDVKRLDRLVSDISNASRLDSDLVKEEEEEFDLIHMLENLGTHHQKLAEKAGIDFIADLPAEPAVINGLEGRLAQVFVNLITNAISFCEPGDAVRLWARKRQNRVLIVVEDTGPGIPEEALTKVFNRFYSERPEQQFGDHSGLGLAISKQIVEAHGGVIWAENIRPTEVDVTSEPFGARFVVGLPV
ncbi:HAMP domain-containing protein [Rhodophyticola sp. CCM32]|uniref:sensor histidine kinase n=1 Tax=Rhodophyticola sp. CCM32 TaxID=2916397 RepID=UPI00107FB5F5|nr:sensor histidine kinase [Rhodophyticola sp. CCM32]QBY02304.1 HAMP domain-containing protein [Rhodophyticola sp. CCM32]